MKKYFLILIAMVYLLSCESEKDPCDIEYKLNEPGGFGRNEVTFLIDGETVWYSKGSGVSSSGGWGALGSSGGLLVTRYYQYDSLNNIIISNLGDTLYRYNISFTVISKDRCYKNKYINFNLELAINYFNEKSNTERFHFSNSVINDINAGNYSHNSYFPIESEVRINFKDNIVNGTFSGMLYKRDKINNILTVVDSIKISKGVFDFKFDEIQYEEN